MRRTLQLPQDRPIALYLGVLDLRKNIRWLAEQWIANEGFGTGALLLAAGPQAREDHGGELLSYLREAARQHPAHFALHEFSADVASYYRCADVLVLPSVKEGLPNVVLEAMACGLPCVATQVSGTRELIVEGQTGLTYAQGDVAALGNALRQCLSPAGRAMGERARKLALERYDIGAVASAYASLYSALTTTRKRVLYVENGIGYGGAIICLRHLVRSLDRSRFDPMVVTGLGDSIYQDIAREARWKQIPDHRVDVVSMKRRLVASHWPDSVAGLRWFANQLLARLDDVCNFLPSFLQTVWTVMRFRPHLIHVNNEPLCNRAAVLAGKLLGVPVVAHVRGDQQGSLLMHSFFRLPDYFVAVSRWVSESIGSLGVPESLRTYIYDGIELDKLNTQADSSAFRRQHGIPEDAFVIGLVGLLIPWKGQRLFLDAAERLVDVLPRARFAIVGGTPEECVYFENELKQRVKQSSLDGRVFFTGHVGAMDSVYNGLDVVLSASTSPEPLGTMIIEAMTMARAIAAPDHGGALEMIEDDRTGLLYVAEEDVGLWRKISPPRFGDCTTIRSWHVAWASRRAPRHWIPSASRRTHARSRASTSAFSGQAEAVAADHMNAPPVSAVRKPSRPSGRARFSLSTVGGSSTESVMPAELKYPSPPRQSAAADSKLTGSRLRPHGSTDEHAPLPKAMAPARRGEVPEDTHATGAR